MRILNTNFLICLPIFFNRSIFLILFFIPSSFYSQFYQIQNLNAENGLASPEVYGLMQDSKGYMWFATDMGVSRYNGTEFKNFSTENGLPDNTIFGFCEDSKNRIWFRSFSGKLSYFLNDSIYSLPCNLLLEKELRKYNTILTSIYVDEQDTIWVGLGSKCLLKISPQWQEKNVSWITSMKEGGYVYLFRNNAIVSGGSLFNTSLITVYNSSGGLICQVNPQLKTGGRFSAIRLKNGTFSAAINNILFNFSKDKILDRVELSNTINSILEDRNGNIISASYDGISIHHGDHLNTYETIPDFKGKVITGIVIDKENTLWFGAEGQGIYNIPFRDARYYTTEHGLIKSKISCIAEKDGNILTGYLNGMMSVIKGNTIKQLDFISTKFNGQFNKRVNCIYIHNNHDVYVCQRVSTFKLDPNFETYKEIECKAIKKITKSKNGLVWVLKPRVIFLCDIEHHFKIKKEIPFDQYIDEIFEDSKGTLWICAMNGLWNFKNNSLQYLGEKNPLLNTRIVNILEDDKGRLWMSTRGKGVIIKSGNLYKNLTKLNGLASNMCRNQLVDSENNVWIGSNNGISKISLKDSSVSNYHIDVYTKKQGLSSNEVNYILKRDSNLIIAHNNSISILKASFLKSKTPPLLYFTKALNNNHIYKNDTISFLFNRNYLKLFYEVVSFKNSGDIEYKYKMDGLDTNWVYTTYATTQFQALSPGKYKFSIYAKNNDGYWSQKPAVLYITVLPLWYQTLLFKVICFLVIILMFCLIIKKRIDVIKKREHEKNELQNKIATTELKALRAQMNPHFIFNAINSVQYFMTTNDPASSQKYLSKFAKLIRYVLENSKPSTISLDKEIDALKLYMDLEILRFENHFEYQFIIDENINTNFIQIPSMLIQPYVENAIWHGLMHKKNGGKLMICITMKSSILTCIIEDNGIGRVQSQKNKTVESLTQHKSFGMAVTLERIEIISRLNNIAPEVNMIDLYENGLATGTRVEIKFPSF